MVFYSRYHEFEEKDAAFKIGRLFGKRIKEIMAIYEIDDEMDEVQRQALELTASKLPGCIKEIEERARGAGVSFNQMFKYIIDHDFDTRLEASKPSDHCTDVMIKRPDGLILKGHTEDIYATEESCAIIKHITEYGWYVELAIPEALAGATVAWNSKGICFSGNTIYGTQLAKANLPTTLVLRTFVDCGSIDEIVALAKEFPVMADFNLNILDKNSNEACSLEISQNKVSVLRLKDYYVHSNHLLHVLGHEDENTYQILGTNSNTKFRLEKAGELIRGIDISKADYNDLAKIMGYRGADNLSSIHKLPIPGTTTDFTVYTVLCDSVTGTIHVTDHISKEQAVFLW